MTLSRPKQSFASLQGKDSSDGQQSNGVIAVAAISEAIVRAERLSHFDSVNAFCPKDLRHSFGLTWKRLLKCCRIDNGV